MIKYGIAAVSIIAGLVAASPSQAQWIYRHRSQEVIICIEPQKDRNEAAKLATKSFANIYRGVLLDVNNEKMFFSAFTQSPCMNPNILVHQNSSSDNQPSLDKGEALALGLTLARAAMVGQMEANAAKARGATLTKIAASLAQTQQSLSTMQTSLLLGLRSELITRINALPAELAKDGPAYEMLKAR